MKNERALPFLAYLVNWRSSEQVPMEYASSNQELDVTPIPRSADIFGRGTVMSEVFRHCRNSVAKRSVIISLQLIFSVPVLRMRYHLDVCSRPAMDKMFWSYFRFHFMFNRHLEDQASGMNDGLFIWWSRTGSTRLRVIRLYLRQG